MLINLKWIIAGLSVRRATSKAHSKGNGGSGGGGGGAVSTEATHS